MGTRELLKRAVEQWKRQLVDLGGRNSLLHYRDLRQGTLDLTAADSASVAAMTAGKPVTLSRLVGVAALPSSAKRLRTVAAKAKENFEERGLRTLFATWGMATWTSTRGTAIPAAPLLLAELTVAARGSASEDFDLSIAEGWDVNPTLLLWLESEHKIVLDGDALDDLATTSGFVAVGDVVTAAAGAIAGWKVSPRLVVGNFSYAKLPLVRDLDIALQTGALERNDLLASIAGDGDALARMRGRHPQVDAAEPDLMAPHDEFLVLDADASQSFVVNAAAKGANLVVEGPPGTGKSQTIANLIATLTARGERVLFVAEKRAAIDAVLERLRNVGLGDVVLDLHGGAGSRRALAQELAKALDAVGAVGRPDVTELHTRLRRRRQELRRHADAVHQRREPWGVSLFQCQSKVLETPDDGRTETRLSGGILANIGADAFRQARVDLERFASLGGFHLLLGQGAWAPSFRAGALPTPAHAQQAFEALTRVVERSLPAYVGWVDHVTAHCGLRPPATMVDWTQRLNLLDAVHSTLTVFDPAIFDRQGSGARLPALLGSLAPGARAGLGGLLSRWFNGGVRHSRVELEAIWKGSSPTLPELHRALTAAVHQQEQWALLAVDGGSPRLPELVMGARAAHDSLVGELRGLASQIAIGGLEALSTDDLRARLAPLIAESATLFKLPELIGLRDRLVAGGLGDLLGELASRRFDSDQVLVALDFAWHMGLATHLSLTDPVIASFDGQAHHRAVEDFRAADRTHIEVGALRVRRAVAEHAVTARDRDPDASAVVQREARKKTRHIPVRELFHLAPGVLTALKPCWAMSPLVVAQLLPVERCFDVVVFDEASQITPADAVGALLRAERAIVAGDTKQLPPTAFFASQTFQDVDDEPVEAGAAPSLTRDMESVLDVMGALLPAPAGSRTLGWHYRSRDERLIAFSNAQRSLYGGSLTTFPGVSGGHCPNHVLVPHRVSVDDADSSAAEVEAVVDLILDHALRRPDQSLGVITMGVKHADRVAEALRIARKDRDELSAFFERGPAGRPNPEPVFVKNLERVQGDERDAIILSIGYGKSPDGRMAYRFGPLNQEGGERRLNVAITRARQGMTVVSSFSSVDLDPERLRSEGAQMLGRYLTYAESGGSNLGLVARRRDPLNPFERDVESRLTAAGIPLVAQLGASGYWIDFGAQHPARPGQMVLAIECDGASYHASPTARDRDRLRQDHLERLGWKFHRIWSTEWFRHRDREVQRAKAAYEAAVRAADAQEPGTAVDAVPRTPRAPAVAIPPAPPARPARPPRPAIGAGLPITAYSLEQLVQLTLWIESDTLLRTEEQLLAALMDELGFGRRGKRIVAALEEAIGLARAHRRAF